MTFIYLVRLWSMASLLFAFRFHYHHSAPPFLCNTSPVNIAELTSGHKNPRSDSIAGSTGICLSLSSRSAREKAQLLPFMTQIRAFYGGRK